MRILVVEDEPGIRAFLTEGLRGGIGAEVDESEGGDAVQLARRGYDVILTDMHLSDDLDGLTVIREITGFDRRVRFIVMTGKKRLDVARKLVTAIKGNQVVSFLFKPFELEELLIAVRRAGDHRSAAAPAVGRND